MCDALQIKRMHILRFESCINISKYITHHLDITYYLDLTFHYGRRVNIQTDVLKFEFKENKLKGPSDSCLTMLSCLTTEQSKRNKIDCYNHCMITFLKYCFN
jgi:hypothetical protein